MKSFRVRIALAAAILIGATIILLAWARQASSSEKTRESLGNFDSKTQSLIANAKRVVFLVPFSHWDTDWHQSYDAYSKLADQNILRSIQAAKQDTRFRFTLEQVLLVQHFWDTYS